jgi:hypothetical protein
MDEQAVLTQRPKMLDDGIAWVYQTVETHKWKAAAALMAGAGASLTVNGADATLRGIDVWRDYYSQGALVASFVLNGAGRKQGQNTGRGSIASYARPAVSIVAEMGPTILRDFMGMPGFCSSARHLMRHCRCVLKSEPNVRTTVLPQALLIKQASLKE